MKTVGSDFSGVGAFNQALIRLGIDFKEVFACDMDKYARQTFIHNYGEPEYYPENVYDREIPNDSLDIYMTSPPCQAFSLAGKRKGEDDKRGVLFYNSHEFIKVNNPRYFIFENVKGLLSDDGGKTFQRWIDMLAGKSVNGNPVIFPHEESVPYHVYYQVMNAKHYGVPQNRERIFIIGIRDDADNSFSFPKPYPLVKRLKDVLEDNVDEKYFLSEKMVAGFLAHGERHDERGNGFAFEPNDINKPARSITTASVTRNTDNYIPVGFINQDTQASAVFSEDGTSPTLSAGTHGYAQGYIQVKSATSQGYEIATENDSINFSVPNSETRRGRVGKGVAQTLDTACNQGVMVNGINKIGQLPGHESTGRIYGTNGISPTITAKQGGGHEPYIETDEVVQLNPSLESGGKQPYQQNRVYADYGVMTCLDTDSGKKSVMITGNDNLFENTNYGKEGVEQALSALREEIGTSAVESWGLRVLETIREEDLLQSGMYEKSIFGEAQETQFPINEAIKQSKGARTVASVIMRSLPKEIWEGCSPQGRKSVKQFIRELNEGLQIMPHENSSPKTNLQTGKLSGKSQGLRLLRKALPTIQKVWESIDVQRKPTLQSYRIRRLTVREVFRLMDFPDTFNWPVSDSQAYKQAGNSIVVNCLVEIIRKFRLD